MSNYASVKLSSAFIEEARKEAEVVHRSLGSQVEYWAKLGRAIERAPGFDVRRIRAALDGRLLEAMAPAEQDAAFDQLEALFDNPPPQVRDHYASLGAADGAVGSDPKGRLVKRRSSGRGRRAA
jgi:hypothetical protein